MPFYLEMSKNITIVFTLFVSLSVRRRFVRIEI